MERRRGRGEREREREKEGEKAKAGPEIKMFTWPRAVVVNYNVPR